MSVAPLTLGRRIVRTSVRRRELEAGFWIVALSYLLVLAVGAIPSPLYGLYQHRDGFSTFTITLIFAAYTGGTTVSLFLVGHISDWYGRKRVLIPGMAMSAASILVLLLWRDLPGLYLGRVMGGLGVGAVSGTATAYVAELRAAAHPGGSPRLVALVSAGVSLAGLGLGALVSGFLAQYVTSPLTVPYLVFLGLFFVAGVGALMTPETRQRPFPAPKYHTQRVSVPARSRGQFFAATAGAAVAFAGFGLFTSLAGFVLDGTLHRTALSLAGATVFTVFAGATATQFITMTWSRRAVLVAGMASMIGGVGLVVLAVWLSSPSLAIFLIGGLFTGLGGGAMFKGSLGTVMMISDLEHRAEAVAGILLAGYVGLAVPAISAGVALNAGVSTKDTLLGFAIAVAVALAASVPVLLRQASQPAVVPQEAPESAPSLSSSLSRSRKSGIRETQLQHLTPQNKGENIMSVSTNRDLVVKALTELFIDGDASALDRYWSGDDYIQHNPRFPNGVDGLRRNLIGTNVTYEMGFAVGTGDIVMVHGRFTGNTPKPLIAVDIFRVSDGKIAEHWDVLQEEEDSASGNPMFDPAEAATSGVYASAGR